MERSLYAYEYVGQLFDDLVDLRGGARRGRAAMVGKQIAEAAVHHFLEELTTRLDRQLATKETQGASA